MNPNILSIEVQTFLKENSTLSPAQLALRKTPFAKVSAAELAEQLDARQRLSKKLPRWLAVKNIYLPPCQNAEQCSSEASAHYKAKLCTGKCAIDLTGGFGVDTWAFSQQFDQVHYCEIDEHLFAIAKHNFTQLERNNIHCHKGDSIAFLKQQQHFDLIYLDPARRDAHKRKMVSFANCFPNILTLLDLLFSHSHTVMLKASPMMDISLALKELAHVKEVHVVAVKNECKELLFILEKKEGTAQPKITATNIGKQTTEHFVFSQKDEGILSPHYALPQNYLYEPNVAVLKAGAFNTSAHYFDLYKLHPFTHLYTSNKLCDYFCGKTYKITHVLDYKKNDIAPLLPEKKANIKTYNFVHTPQQIKKKLGINDGGDTFLFGIKTMKEKYQVLLTQRCKA